LLPLAAASCRFLPAGAACPLPAILPLPACFLPLPARFLPLRPASCPLPGSCRFLPASCPLPGSCRFGPLPARFLVPAASARFLPASWFLPLWPASSRFLPLRPASLACPCTGPSVRVERCPHAKRVALENLSLRRCENVTFTQADRCVCFAWIAACASRRQIVGALRVDRSSERFA
jgi:hypothetical protein